jgi:hypothetical protein
MLPRAGVADECLGIKGEANVSEMRMIVPVSSEIVPLVIFIDETANTSRHRVGHADIGANQLTGAAAVKVTDHHLVLF